MKIILKFLVNLLLLIVIVGSCHAQYRATVKQYPKDTQFWASDFFVQGCRNFIQNCPLVYKYQQICARSFDGDFRNFPNYCEMQYENCNSWRNWRVYKRQKC